MIENVSIRIVGRVQGVGFRMGARHKAVQLHLAGWVANTDDGAVEMEVEGESADIQAFVAWCHEGTILSHVDKVTVTSGKPGLYSEFEIR